MYRTSELKLEWSGVLCKVSNAQDRVALLTLLCKVNKQKFPARKQEVINSAGRLMHGFSFFFFQAGCPLEPYTESRAAVNPPALFKVFAVSLCSLVFTSGISILKMHDTVCARAPRT